MIPAEFREFSGMLGDAYVLLSKPVPPARQMALFFKIMERYSVKLIAGALEAHLGDPVRGRFAPVPADLIAQIEIAQKDDGRPGAEEAWAMSVRSRDEFETVVWTAEMAEAWGIASDVFALGDEVGARMAFKESYLRLTDAARHQRTPAAWSLSLGFDATRRDAAIADAIKHGRLSASEYPLLPPPVNFLMLASSAPETGGPPASVREKMAQLRAAFKQKNDAPMGIDAIGKERTKEMQRNLQSKISSMEAEACY